MRPRFLDRLLLRFFHLLYTQLAWSYDLIAWLASMGQWHRWIRQADLGWGEGRLLEIGQGPGHLLAEMAAAGRDVTGLDPSRQMVRIASRRLRRQGLSAGIVRGASQALPFKSGSYAGVLATFPGPFIFERDTLREIHRVLRPGGFLVIIPLARITGSKVYDRAAAWLNRVTRQSEPPEMNWPSWLASQGFEADQQNINLPRAIVVRIVARKPRNLRDSASEPGDLQADPCPNARVQ